MTYIWAPLDYTKFMPFLVCCARHRWKCHQRCRVSVTGNCSVCANIYGAVWWRFQLYRAWRHWAPLRYFLAEFLDADHGNVWKTGGKIPFITCTDIPDSYIPAKLGQSFSTMPWKASLDFRLYMLRSLQAYISRLVDVSCKVYFFLFCIHRIHHTVAI